MKPCTSSLSFEMFWNYFKPYHYHFQKYYDIPVLSLRFHYWAVSALWNFVDYRFLYFIIPSKKRFLYRNPVCCYNQVHIMCTVPTKSKQREVLPGTMTPKSFVKLSGKLFLIKAILDSRREHNIIFDGSSCHCVKSVRIRSYFGPYSVRIRENTDPNNSQYGHVSRSVSQIIISFRSSRS